MFSELISRNFSQRVEFWEFGSRSLRKSGAVRDNFQLIFLFFSEPFLELASWKQRDVHIKHYSIVVTFLLSIIFPFHLWLEIESRSHEIINLLLAKVNGYIKEKCGAFFHSCSCAMWPFFRKNFLFPAGNKELLRTTRLYSFFQKFSPGWQITESAKAKFYRQYYQGTCIRIWIYNNNQKVSNSSKLVLC